MKRALSAYISLFLCVISAAAFLTLPASAAVSTRKVDGPVTRADIAHCFRAIEDIGVREMKADYDACKDEAEATIARNKLAKQIQKEKKKKISDEKAMELALSPKYSGRYLEMRESVKDSDKSSYALKKISDPFRKPKGYVPLTTSWFCLLVAALAVSAVISALKSLLGRRKGKGGKSRGYWGMAPAFWLLAFVFSPILLKFYAELNPVAGYAACINRPGFWGYASMPAIQAGIFLILTRVIAGTLLRRRNSGGFLGGVSVCLVSAVISLIGLVGLNFLGLGIITTIAGNIVVVVLKLIFYLFFILLTLIH